MYKHKKSLICILLTLFIVLSSCMSSFAQETSEQTVPKASVSISIEGTGQIVQDIGMPTEKLHRYSMSGNYERGTKFVLTAQETTCKFLYWRDVNSQRIISFNKDLVITLGTGIKIAAVFRSSSTDKKLVLFHNKNGHILSSEYASDEKIIDTPQTPAMYAHTFDAWMLGNTRQEFSNNKLSVSTLEGDGIFCAQYAVDPTLYEINVSGGSGTGSYKYNTNVVIELDEAAIPAGKHFAYWSNGNDILSYDKKYSFYVSSNANISAVYQNAQISEKRPTLSIEAVDTDVIKNKITFISQRSLPLDYEFIETGIIISTRNDFDLTSGGISKVVSTSNKSSGQFCVRKSAASSSDVWYARAYMIYSKDGVSDILYSDIISASVFED